MKGIQKIISKTFSSLQPKKKGWHPKHIDIVWIEPLNTEDDLSRVNEANVWLYILVRMNTCANICCHHNIERNYYFISFLIDIALQKYS